MATHCNEMSKLTRDVKSDIMGDIALKCEQTIVAFLLQAEDFKMDLDEPEDPSPVVVGTPSPSVQSKIFDQVFKPIQPKKEYPIKQMEMV